MRAAAMPALAMGGVCVVFGGVTVGLYYLGVGVKWVCTRAARANETRMWTPQPMGLDDAQVSCHCPTCTEGRSTLVAAVAEIELLEAMLRHPSQGGNR